MIMLNETDYSESGVTRCAALPTSSTLPDESGYISRQIEYNGPPPCTGCGQVILDQFILRVQNRLWHADCLRCASCQCALTRDCFARGSHVYCQDDFFRLFGARCVGCCEPISPSEHVRRAHENIYHPSCFTCHCCDIELQTGDEFYLRADGKLICRHDYDLAKDKEGSDSGSDQPSPKRTRLFMTPEQTDMLEKAYKSSGRPSWTTLEKLSKDVDLDVKTVQVWFKNQRIREKRTRSSLSWIQDTAGSLFKDNTVGSTSPAPIVNREFSRNVNSTSRKRRKGTKPDTSSKKSYWSMSDDMWSATFVPPNVELTPEDIKDGEVCSRRNMRICTDNDITHNEESPSHHQTTDLSSIPVISDKNTLHNLSWTD